MSDGKINNLGDATIFTIKTQEISSTGRNAREKETDKQKIGGFRHIVAILALSSIVLANANRQAYNQSLTYMVKKNVNKRANQTDSNSTEVPSESETSTPYTVVSPTSFSYEIGSTEALVNSTTSSDAISEEINVSKIEATSSLIADEDGYDWSGAQISLLQSAFAYGYTPFMIPGGRMSEVYGAKWVVFLSGFGSAICSLAVPFLADYSFILLVISRTLMGKS